MQVLFKENYGVLEYDETVPCVTARFLAFMDSEKFKSFLTKGLDVMIQKKTKNKPILWLADTRKHLVQPESDTRWVAEVWNDRALKNGIHHVAFVMPENVFGESSVKNYAKNTQKTDKKEMQIGMFNTEKEAREWFKVISG